MREIIPLKKDIVFNTIIGEITSINLEHDYKIKDDVVSGNVCVSGSYKMTEASVIEEEFFYKIPFGVSISSNIDKDTIKIDIDDFKYETVKDILKVNIDLEFTCEEKEKNEEELSNTGQIEEENGQIEEENYFENENVTVKSEQNNINIEENISNITNNIINNDNKYYTYKIYIVRQGDTIESICNKYNVTKDELKEYNDINNININDKIIIPQINE